MPEDVTLKTEVIINPLIVKPSTNTGLGGGTSKQQQNKIRTSITAPTLGIGIGEDVMKFNTTDGLFIGNKVFASAPFSVSIAGALTATGATITGAITATDLKLVDGTMTLSSQTTAQVSFFIVDTVSTANSLAVFNGFEVLTSYVFLIEAAKLTTGGLLDLSSNSSTTSTRSLLRITNDNTAATGVTPLRIIQDAVTSTNFKKTIDTASSVIWISDGTTPAGNLSGVIGDLCLNGPTGELFYCTATGTNWTSTAGAGGSGQLDKDTTAFTNVSTGNPEAYSFTIPGGTMGADDKIIMRCSAVIDNAGELMTATFKFNGVTYGTLPVAANSDLSPILVVQNDGSTGSQLITFEQWRDAGGGALIERESNTASIDTTGDIAISVNVDWVATGLATMSWNPFTVEIIRAV